MHDQGSPSHILINLVDTSEPLHFILFVRDAFALRVEHSARLPPQLLNTVPALGGLADSKTRELMAQHWPVWWESTLHGVLESEVGRRGGGRYDDKAGSMSRVKEHYFSRLSLLTDVGPEERPGLLSQIMKEWKWWFSRERRTYGFDVDSGRPRHPALVRQIVEELNSSEQATGSAVVAMVQLNVVGPWLQHRRPGVILHSPQLLEDEVRCRQAVRQARLTAREYFEETLTSSLGSTVVSDEEGAELFEGLPLVVGTLGETQLVLHGSQQFVDGIELHFKLVGALTSFPSEASDSPGGSRPPGIVRNGAKSLGLFEGLLVEVTYPLRGDKGVAQEVLADSTHNQTKINEFLRKPFDPTSLWLWVTPAPRDGILDISVEWPALHLPRTTRRVATRGNT